MSLLSFKGLNKTCKCTQKGLKELIEKDTFSAAM